MKTYFLIGCLIGSIFVSSGDFEGTTDAYLATPNRIEAKTETLFETANKIIIASMTPSPEPNATEAKAEQAVNMNETAKEQQLMLQTVNNVSLYDDPTSVIEKLGQPEQIIADEYLEGIETYQYPAMKIIFSDGIVDFVEIEDLSRSLLIDDAFIPATVEDLQAALGEPDYITEDGIVFERNEALLKLFIGSDTKQLTSVSYFHNLSM